MPEYEEMPSTVFRLVYDGEAVRDGEMDVADLAPALLAVGQMAKAVGRAALGDNADVKVRVKTLKEGSFDIWLDVGVTYWQQVRDILAGSDATAAVLLVTLLFGSPGSLTSAGLGVVKLVKRLKGQRPKQISKQPGGNVQVEIDGETIEVPDMVLKLAYDPVVRAALDTMIAEQLAKNGIDSVELRRQGAENTRIEKSEGDYFRMPSLSSDEEFETKHVKMFSIVSLSFKHGNKWKLSDGHGAAKSVVMLDDDFITRVDKSQIRFAKGDVLICDVREVTRQTATGLKAEYQILRVIEHKPASDPQDDFGF